MRGAKRVRDSAIVQFVLRWEKDSVAARKIETSWGGPLVLIVGLGEGLALGMEEEVFKAGPKSVSAVGEGGGVG